MAISLIASLQRHGRVARRKQVGVRPARHAAGPFFANRASQAARCEGSMKLLGRQGLARWDSADTRYDHGAIVAAFARLRTQAERSLQRDEATPESVRRQVKAASMAVRGLSRFPVWRKGGRGPVRRHSEGREDDLIAPSLTFADALPFQTSEAHSRVLPTLSSLIWKVPVGEL